MKLVMQVVAMCLLSGLLLVPSTYAQPCPLVYGTWVYSLQGFQLPTELGTVAAAGRLTVSTDPVTGLPILTSVQSSSMNGSIISMETVHGRVQVNPDCLGGLFSFAIWGRPVQLSFFFANANQLLLIGSGIGSTISGTANRAVPVSAGVCSTDPLQSLFPGLQWAYSAQGFGGQLNFLDGAPRPATLQVDNNNILFGPVALAGHFQPAISPEGRGILSEVQTSSTMGYPTVRETDPGRYQVNGNCTAGTLTLNTSTRPVPYDFFFVSPVQLVLLDTRPGDTVAGQAVLLGNVMVR